MNSSGGCKVMECTGKYHAKGYCAKHYMRYHRHKDTSIVNKSGRKPLPHCRIVRLKFVTKENIKHEAI